MTGKRFVIGDIHGNFKALSFVISLACHDLSISRFSEIEQLIILGDVVDGYSKTKECIDFLLSFGDRLMFILGNHDLWAYNWFKTSVELPIWVHQGGYATMQSYDFDYKSVPESHKNMISSAPYYYIDAQNNLFIHGGFDPDISMSDQDIGTMVWDRELWQKARLAPIKGYNRIFIGHSTTQLVYNDVDHTTPIFFNNLVMLDTGAGWNGRLTLMDIDTLQYWSSGKYERY